MYKPYNLLISGSFKFFAFWVKYSYEGETDLESKGYKFSYNLLMFTPLPIFWDLLPASQLQKMMLWYLRV